MAPASYVDVAALSALLLAATAVSLVASRLCFRVGWYICKWATAWAVVSALAAALDAFPVYGVVKGALFDAAANVYETAGGEAAVHTVWSALQERVAVERARYNEL